MLSSARYIHFLIVEKDNIENVVKNDHVDVLITNMKTKGFFHSNHCGSITLEDMQVR